MIIIWKFVRNSRLCTHTLCRRKGCDCEANPRLLLPPYTLYIMQFYAAVTVSVVAMVTGCCYRYCSTRDAAKSSKNRSRCVIIYRYFCIWMTSFILIHRCKMCYWRCLHNTRSKVCNRYVTVGCPSVRLSHRSTAAAAGVGRLFCCWARASVADIDRQLRAPCCKRRCSAENGGSVMLRADGGGLTRTWIFDWSIQIQYSKNSKEQNCVDWTERLKEHLQLP